MKLANINFPLQNKQCLQPSIYLSIYQYICPFLLLFLSILSVAMFQKVYKCKRKFSKLVGNIKPAFPQKTFDFLSETKDRTDQRLCHICLAKIKLSITQHFQRFESTFYDWQLLASISFFARLC